ncbi:hypothetical protein EWM64_g1241 [Hericium alpestre]|uniref:DUF6532 domain-containing protein n=1 Tax=Hericium alpestre TaxID=135208 RepID=A0A4Z0A8Z9_9AGAM|nr:hypothetical protein EWM64_g1241 [Hericium alpestre]
MVSQGQNFTFVFDAPISTPPPPRPQQEKSQQMPPPVAPAKWQSARSNKGQGGALAQLEKAGEQVQRSAIRRTPRFQSVTPAIAPAEQTLNPMAPAQQAIPKQRRKGKQLLGPGAPWTGPAQLPQDHQLQLAGPVTPTWTMPFTPDRQAAPATPTISQLVNSPQFSQVYTAEQPRTSIPASPRVEHVPTLTGPVGHVSDAGNHSNSEDDELEPEDHNPQSDVEVELISSAEEDNDEHQSAPAAMNAPAPVNASALTNAPAPVNASALTNAPASMNVPPSVQIQPHLAAGRQLNNGLCVTVSVQSTNVLDQHWQMNRTPKAPNLRALLKLQQQNAGRAVAGADATDSDEESTAAALSSLKRPKGSRTSRKEVKCRRASKAKEDGDDDDSDVEWKETLRLAKARTHLYLLTVDAFPDVETFLTEASECIYEACQQIEENGGISPIQRPNPVPPKYVKKVYDDQSTFRGNVKRAGANLLVYSCIPAPIAGRSKAQNCAFVKDEITGLLANGQFLHGRDENGNHVNFGSDYLEHLSTLYLFKDDKRLGKGFPSVFGEELPVETIAFFATVLTNNFDEWKTGKHMKIDFTATTYTKVYSHLLAEARATDNNVKHGPIFKALRQRWSKNGREGIWNNDDNKNAEDDNRSFGIDLS